MRALSIRQPYAELILRGIKTVEYRSRPTQIIGERFWIYAAKGSATKRQRQLAASGIWSDDLAVAPLPDWMLELAQQVRLIEPGTLLPTGMIVGSAMIDRVSEIRGGVTPMFRWHLSDVERAATLRKPHGHPQPSWFKPF